MTNLAEDLLKNYQIQFAENQRNREQSFLKIVGFLGAVVFGYAYVYVNLSHDQITFSLVTMAAVILLLFGSAIITVIAYSFRRQQYVTGRINRHAQLIGPGKPLPSDYDPSHLFATRVKRLMWMPDIFLIFYLVFPLFQLIVLASFAAKSGQGAASSTWNPLHVWTLAVAILSLAASLGIVIAYGKKLRKKLERWEKETARTEPGQHS